MNDKLPAGEHPAGGGPDNSSAPNYTVEQPEWKAEKPNSPYAVEQLLSLLWRNGTNRAYGYICTIDPDGKVKPHKATPQTAYSQAQKYAGKANIYFGVNPIHPRWKGGKPGGEDVAAIACVFADFDCGEGKPYPDKAAAKAHIDSLTLAPSMLVDSGGGYHAYWCLVEPVPPDDKAASLQRRWVELVGGDKAAKDTARMLRLPGFANLKYEDKPITTIVEFHPERLYSLDELVALLPPEEPEEPEKPKLPEPKQEAPHHFSGWWQEWQESVEATAVQAWNIPPRGAGEWTSRNFSCPFHKDDNPSAGWNYERHFFKCHSTQCEGIERSIHDIAEALGHESWQSFKRRKYAAAMLDADGEPKKPDDLVLALMVMQKYPNIGYGLMNWRLYNPAAGYWEAEPEPIRIRQLVQNVLAETPGVRVSSSRVKSVMEVLQTQVFIPNNQWDTNDNLLACTNGTYNFETNRLEPHRMENYLSSGVNQPYDPHAPHEMLDKVIGRLEPEVQAFLQEFAGYCLTTDTHHDMAVVLMGPRGSGKSTFIELQLAAYGPLAAVFGLEDLEDSAFGLAHLVGKRVAMATEGFGDRYVQKTGILNRMISGEPITINQKHVRIQQIRLRAKLLWALNDMFRVKSGEDGLLRRLYIVQWPELPEEERDPSLRVRIQGEAAGFLAWAVEGLKRLRARGHFEIPASVKRANAEYEREQNHELQFLEAYAVRDGGNYSLQESYEAYLRWCKDEGIQYPRKANMFAKRCNKLGWETFTSSGRSKSKGWHAVYPTADIQARASEYIRDYFNRMDGVQQ